MGVNFMGAFNTVIVDLNNPASGSPTKLRIQFKFGETRQHIYHIGDTLKWGGNDIGPPDARYVVVDGAVEGDPPPGIGEDFEVYIKDGVIEKVQPSTGKFDFVNSEDTYIILEQ
jgi:hypothetical protein